ncbi:MAG: DUF4437 domain-containing protein [Chromatiales bacterium]|nr:DUF4437 domain-containing protein [Chromatiales bacterium]
MARDHVEFLQSQQIPWQPCPWQYPGPGSEIKLLSLDRENGACSYLARLRPGWRQPAGALSATEELFVLEGSLQLGEHSLGPDFYTRVPAGAARPSAHSDQGALLLGFLDATPRQADVVAGLAARLIDTFQTPWGHEGMDPAYADLGMRWKILHHDEDSLDTSMLVLTPSQLGPPGLRGPQERHDCIEEAFLISGDFLSPLGPMHAGGYFWRPPQVLHGPYASRHGNVCFIRTLGDLLENNWSTHELTLDREAAVRPVVPAATYPALQPWAPDARY